MGRVWGFFRKRPRLAGGLLAFVALFTVVVVLLWPWIVGGWRQGNAEKLAESYANRLYPDLKGRFATCQATDTDRNGYVSCTLRIVRGDGEEELIPLECNSYLFLNFGDTCRPVSALRGPGSPGKLR